MHYLVTGAAGFIGSAVARRLIDMGHDVTTIDNLSTGYEKNIPDGCRFIKGNVQDKSVIDKLHDQKFEAIIHIAGQSSGEVSFEKPIYDLQTNTQSTLMLLDFAKATKCNKFLYASSMSVYGDHERGGVNEMSSTTPKSFYAVGKLASENYLRIYSQFGIKCTALRFFNVYGIGQNMENLKQGMASIFLAMAINDRHIVVKGAKDRFRDFVYIDDVVDAVLRAEKMENGDLFEVLNVSTNKKTTVESVVGCISNNLPYEVSVQYVGGTPGDQHGIYGDNSKIMNLLGWKPQTSFEDGMRKMVLWALENRRSL